MTVRSEGNDALDAGANPAISTSRVVDLPRNLFFTEREWNKNFDYAESTGMNSFDRASSSQTDSPIGEERNSSKTK